MKVIHRTFHASGLETATGDGTDVTDIKEDSAVLYLDVTAVSGTAPTLDINYQEKDPLSGQYYTVQSFTQATAVTTQRIALSHVPGDTARISWTIGGTAPNFTFSVSWVGKELV